MNTRTHYRHDYQAPTFSLDAIELTFDIYEKSTHVKNRMRLTRQHDGPCVLNGSATLVSILLNGTPLDKTRYRLDINNETLELLTPPDTPFILEIETHVFPHENHSLMGLYCSNGNLFTQCEPEGFRKISYSLDRPDVMSTYTVTLIADTQQYPILLSNGDCVARGIQDTRHWAKWVDPHKKPSYLFALVAGQFEKISDTFITQSGKTVQLELYAQMFDINKTAHAMNSLKRAMRWDEVRFGLEYDLDTYMIVAVHDFNMGAMENKGLNIFNTRYVLARPDTATDADYQAIESVIGHEYFHNWTGNRVTCRDWFQLSLKEGLTVFRDQEFSGDLNDAAVQRIEDVKRLRAFQFPEDSGPQAHCVRPDSYIEINNFYTMTVYEKGAEIVRMYQTLLGREGFRAGLTEYLTHHDGQAATCDDFLAAMSRANQQDLSQMERWYSQAGTPRVRVTLNYSPQHQTATLDFEQSCPPTPNQANKLPFLIPIRLSLFNEHGQAFKLFDHETPQSTQHAPLERLITLKERHQRITFYHINSRPIPSLFRNFSAPIICEYAYQDEELLLLFQHDNDPFNQWEAGQRVMRGMILHALEHHAAFDTTRLEAAFIAILNHETLKDSFKALALTLPSLQELLDIAPEPVDPVQLSNAVRTLTQQLAHNLYSYWHKTWHTLHESTQGEFHLEHAGSRRLKNLALYYLTQADSSTGASFAQTQFQHAQSMTDSIGALDALRDVPETIRMNCLIAFEEKWETEPLVLDKWFALHASSRLPNTFETVKQLLEHRKFSLQNPNNVRALLGSFAQNLSAFHQLDGAPYAFLVDQILCIDSENPQLAARLCNYFTAWRRFAQPYREQMQRALERLNAAPLSKDCFEIVSKALQSQ